MIPVPLWALAAAVAALLACSGGAYWFGRTDGQALERGAQDREQRIVIAAAEQTQRAVAAQIAGIEIKHVTIRQQLETEIREKPVYRECLHAPDVLRTINAALVGTEPNPVGDRQLPSPDAAH